MENQNRNLQQDLAITELKKDICWMKKEISGIKEQVFNELPHKIDKLDDKLNDKIDDLKNKLLFGFIIGIVSVIIFQIILQLF